MADYEKYYWLVWTIATSLFAYFYFPLTVTVAFFLSGMMISSKCLVEDFLILQEEEKQNEKKH
ncbi:hypothetical protein [Mesobacillus selenatarsenatis]|uniref:Uncharacterized protein n=1 Tax=Mesobacillus selenatarsenatis TaxID=388741 RepID=A0A846TUX8_9BACI|nr:hypothetical protein [Mesobacillus selenatarsenatis]NKE06151.1 hypothetical protein [Mesobacillus selenatarsenatis]